ncbi:MAG TPA: hypothetical protein VMW86_08990 [Dehalococcoidales bacterium]|nr:hypothetical protein [Dehalococcoidales bacterium]
MLFNLHNGQVRFRSAGEPIFRNKAKFGRLYMRQIKGFHQGIYNADQLGNIDVQAPEHIDVMVGLGYPIYDGDGKQNPVPKDDLIYPNLDLKSTYWRRIKEAKSSRR